VRSFAQQADELAGKLGGWAACEEILGFPPPMVNCKFEVDKLKKALSEQETTR
jgi:hypothetical protein